MTYIESKKICLKEKSKKHLFSGVP